MQLCFRNPYSSPLSVAVMWYSPGVCGLDPGDWAAEGWWNLNPGDDVHTDVWTNNRYFCIYAEAEDGAVWGGDYGPVDATYQAFKGCASVGSSADNLTLGMELVDAGPSVGSISTYTWSFIP